MTLRVLTVLFLVVAGCGGDDVNDLPDAPVPDADDDGDGVINAEDNCPDVSNIDQADADDNGIGDACQDTDGDGVLDTEDNCPAVANTDQKNSDTDALGDVCDDDDDNDGIADAADNCPTALNADQADFDGDLVGDECDDDDDNDTILDAVDNCPFVANTGQEDTDANGHGDACDGAVTPSFNGDIIGGNIATAGVGFAGRFDAVADPTADLVLAGIPAGAKILRANLYWTVIGQAFPTLTFAGTAVTGSEIGQTEDTCWQIGNNFMYRANVTTLVTGNGTFTLSNLLSATDLTPDGQGASLVVIYSDPADTRKNHVSINDGAIFVASGTPGTSVASGFTIGAGFDKVTAINVVADGQDASDTIAFQDTLFEATDAFAGLQGAMWDTRIDDISSAIVGGETQVTTTIDSSSDCLAWSSSIVVIEDIDDVVAPAKRMPRTPQTKLLQLKPVVRADAPARTNLGTRSPRTR